MTRTGTSSSSRALFLALLLAGAPAFAGSAEDAEALIKKGVELRKQDKEAEALELFRKADQLHTTPRAKAQMALAEQALNLWLEAEEHLKEAMRAETDPWIKQNKEVLDQVGRTIAQNLGWVSVETNAPGAEVRLNGRKGKPGKSRVIAGAVHIEVSAEGYEPQGKDVRVVAGSEVKESFTLAPLKKVDPTPSAIPTTTSTAPPTRDTPPPSSSSQKTVGFVVGGAGILALGAGIFFGLRTLDLKKEYDELCPGSICDPPSNEPRGRQAYDDGKTSSLLSTIGFGVGIVAIGVGVYLVLTAPKSPPPVTARANGAAFTIRF